ncbi:MAG: restriction endonuclease subunit S [Patescibacteria group bacterium]
MTKTAPKKNIPKGWQVRQIKDLLGYERPDRYIVENNRYIKAGTPVLTANKSFVLGYTDEKDGIYTNLPAIIFDDFTTDSKFADFPFKVKSSAIKILKERGADVDLQFVYEKMKSINFPTGSHKRYYISQYQNMEVLVPPHSEQKKIAEILSVVDEEIQKTDEIITATEKLKGGLMQQLFTRGIGHTKFKRTEIGEVPSTWDVKKLGDVLDTSSGGTPLKSKKEYYEGGTIPWLTSGEVRQGRVYNATQYITNAGLKNSSAKIFPKSTVLVAMYGATAGQVGFLSINASTNQAVCGVLPSEHFNPEFVYYFLSNKTEELISKARGAAQPNISQTVIREMYISRPSVSEQKEIANILTSVDEKISINQKLKGKLFLLKKGLMQDLLTGSVRVKTP